MKRFILEQFDEEFYTSHSGLAGLFVCGGLAIFLPMVHCSNS